MSRRELPADPNEGPPPFGFVGHSELRPMTVTESLMAAEPYTTPQVSREERWPLRERVADAIDQLGDEDRWIFDALFVRKSSLRELGRELSLSKTAIARKRDRMLKQLQSHLGEDPLVQEYLHG